jgi:hypothetical protein
VQRFVFGRMAVKINIVGNAPQWYAAQGSDTTMLNKIPVACYKINKDLHLNKM